MHEDRDHERGVFQPELHAGAGVPVGQRLGSVEVACWPAGAGKDRKYGGVVRVDVGALSRTRVDEIKGECAAKGVEISALGYCPNPLDDALSIEHEDPNWEGSVETVKQGFLVARRFLAVFTAPPAGCSPSGHTS